jgi:hypothetical protein
MTQRGQFRLRAIGDLPLRAQAGARLSLSHPRLTKGRCPVMWLNVPAAETFRYQIRIAGPNYSREQALGDAGTAHQPG